MSDPAGRTVSGVGHVTVRYWAAARAAAGVDAEPVPVEEGATLADVLDEVRSRHGARSRLAEVLAVCSVLVAEQNFPAPTVVWDWSVRIALPKAEFFTYLCRFSLLYQGTVK